NAGGLKVRKLARYHGLVLKRTDADRGVESFLDQIHHSIRERYIERDIGIGAGKINESRTELLAKGNRCAEFQEAARLCRFLRGSFQLIVLLDQYACAGV